MDIDEILASIDAERLYQHVLRLEGVRHPVTDPDGLNRAADYIKEQLSGLDVAVSEQRFSLDGFDFPFRNIEGVINEGRSPELLVTSHYDTVRNSPGADDNASAVAVMLEAARVLKESEMEKTVRFVSFTLEEGHPALGRELLDHGKQLGLLDDQYRYTTFHAQQIIKKHGQIRVKSEQEGKNPADSWEIAYKELESELTPVEKQYLDKQRKLYVIGNQMDWIGQVAIIGSSAWAKKAKSQQKELLGVINVETVGYMSKNSNSQQFPPGPDPQAFPEYKVNVEEAIGDFIAIISDDRSSFMGEVFFDQCKRPSIDLAAFLVAIPLDMEQIAQLAPDVLRSDHASFWKEGYPAIMLTDMANFRTPYYHTPADTIDKLDFDFIKKVCQATVMTALELQVAD
ncbi:MAG: M28 family peptidase [Candidatus Odinarchaeota archaeon]